MCCLTIDRIIPGPSQLCVMLPAPTRRRGCVKEKVKSRSNQRQLTDWHRDQLNIATCSHPVGKLSDQCMCCNLAVNTVRGTFKSGDDCGFEEYIARPRRGKVTILRVADNNQSGHLSGKKTGDLLWSRTCEGMGI